MLIKLKRIFTFSTIFALFLSFSLILILPPATLADGTTPTGAQQAQQGLDVSAKGTGLIAKTTTPQVIIGTIVSAILSFIGVIFFLLIFYGGIRWMLAQGNEQEVETAKKIIIAAVIGLVIVLAAYAITAFVGQTIAGG